MTRREVYGFYRGYYGRNLPPTNTHTHMNDMTIEDVKNAKLILEETLWKEIRAFEGRTGVKVDSVELLHGERADGSSSVLNVTVYAKIE